MVRPSQSMEKIAKNLHDQFVNSITSSLRNKVIRINKYEKWKKSIGFVFVSGKMKKKNDLLIFTF
jgi:hypothetical protein